MKGISPLIAVIMLIAFVLVVSGIFYGWLSQFAYTKRSEFQMCSRASIILESAYYNQNTGNVHLLVRNSGDVPLKGFTVLLSSRGSRQPEILRFLEKEIGSGEMGIFQVGYEEGVDSMVVQSVECKNAQDMIWIRDVEGL